MTEPNDATTPLSRMRFSWQRDRGPGRRAPGTAPGPPPPTGRPPEEYADGADAAWSTGEQPVVPPSAARPRLTRPSTPLAPGQDTGAYETVGQEAVDYGHGRPAQSVAPSQALPAQAPLWSSPPVEPASRREGGRTGPVRPQADGLDRPVRPRTAATAAAPVRETARSARSRDPDLADLAERPVPPTPHRRRLRSPGEQKDFDVPPPGGRFSGGRGTHAFVRATLVLTVCLLALGTVAYVAFSFGAMAVQDNSYTLDEADVQRYRLSEFPVESAGRFAADFARLCLTHNPDPAAVAQRKRDIAAYVVDGVDPMCGWNGEGEQYVTDATWTGRSEPIDTPGYAGHARMMAVRVLTDTGSRIVEVPVYVKNLREADGMRVIGEIGEMPQPTLVGVPRPAPEAATDNALAVALEDGEFFTQFFRAWGASERSTLQRLITPDAGAAAKNGLAGSLEDPRIVRSRVFFPKGVDGTDPDFSWEVGAVTEAWVWVSWRNPQAGEETRETRAYRLQLVKTTQAPDPAQEWTVRDIRGGVPAVQGG